MQIVPITNRSELDAFFAIVTRGSAAAYVARRAKSNERRLAEAEAGARAMAAEAYKIIAENRARRAAFVSLREAA